MNKAIGCHQCSKALKPSGPSPDFCNYECQRLWHEKFNERRASRPATLEQLARAIGVEMDPWQRALLETMVASRTHTTVTAPQRDPKPSAGGVVGGRRGWRADLVIVDEAFGDPHPPSRRGWLSRWIRRHR